jgi:hypothetical protein
MPLPSGHPASHQLGAMGTEQWQQALGPARHRAMGGRSALGPCQPEMPRPWGREAAVQPTSASLTSAHCGTGGGGRPGNKSSLGWLGPWPAVRERGGPFSRVWARWDVQGPAASVGPLNAGATRSPRVRRSLGVRVHVLHPGSSAKGVILVTDCLEVGLPLPVCLLLRGSAAADLVAHMLRRHCQFGSTASPPFCWCCPKPCLGGRAAWRYSMCLPAVVGDGVQLHPRTAVLRLLQTCLLLCCRCLC